MKTTRKNKVFKTKKFTELDILLRFQLTDVKVNGGRDENGPLVFFSGAYTGIVQKYDTRWTDIVKFDRLLGLGHIQKQLGVVADHSAVVTLSHYVSSSYQESYLVAFEPKKQGTLGSVVFNKHFPYKLSDVTIQHRDGVYKFYYCGIRGGKVMGFILYVAEKRLIEEQNTIRNNDGLELISLFN